MAHVSFEDCEMVSVIFSDNCGLSTVIIDPKKQIKFNNWNHRPVALKSRSQRWTFKEQHKISDFINTHLRHAPRQNWYILSIEDVNKTTAPL
jgi:hypothetical protein